MSTSIAPARLEAFRPPAPARPEGKCIKDEQDTCYVSYGFAAGENLVPVNEVVVPPEVR